MKVDVLLARAESALGKPVEYDSPGITPPLDAATWPKTSTAIDCSGFVAWCLRLSRKVDHPLYKRINGGWFETTAIHADGLKSVGFFTRIPKARPGAILVYPDYKDGNGKIHDGHMGIVVEADGSPGVGGVTAIVHCSVGNDKKGSAIQKTPPAPWKAHSSSIIVWYDSLEK
jgi:cell wall-associated NlpC family hydrolase